jgi:hypothetical protein
VYSTYLLYCIFNHTRFHVIISDQSRAAAYAQETIAEHAVYTEACDVIDELIEVAGGAYSFSSLSSSRTYCHVMYHLTNHAPPRVLRTRRRRRERGDDVVRGAPERAERGGVEGVRGAGAVRLVRRRGLALSTGTTCCV